MDGPTPEDDVAPAGSSAQRAVLIALAASAVLGLVVLLAARGAIGELAGAACRGEAQAVFRLRLLVTLVVILVPAGALGIALYLGLTARRIRRAQVFPPPGMWLLRPMRRLRGPAANRVAAAMVVLAAILAVAAAVLFALSSRLLQLLAR
jgi:hypothetical protein